MIESVRVETAWVVGGKKYIVFFAVVDKQLARHEFTHVVRIDIDLPTKTKHTCEPLITSRISLELRDARGGANIQFGRKESFDG